MGFSAGTGALLLARPARPRELAACVVHLNTGAADGAAPLAAAAELSVAVASSLGPRRGAASAVSSSLKSLSSTISAIALCRVEVVCGAWGRWKVEGRSTCVLCCADAQPQFSSSLPLYLSTSALEYTPLVPTTPRRRLQTNAKIIR